jgi:nitrite reductase/ring-hydroxylating ferredoxin subunit/uncharacterized membrane protein
MEAVANKSPLEPLVRQLESASALDPIGKSVGKAARGAFGHGALKEALSGTPLGHAVHPVLTDVVIGSFVSATLLDLLGGDSDGRAAERLIAVGIAAYVPTAATGANDWADSEFADPAVRRVGLVHALSNTTALSLYSASLIARRRGSRARGKVLAAAGATVLTVAGYLGGHLSFTRDVGPNQTAFDPGPSDWSTALDAGDLPAGEPRRVVVEDTPVFLLRHGDGLHAIHDRCSHRGCALTRGKIDGESIVCACHGSRFSLHDGSVEHGPATTGQPAYDVRETEGKIEIRRSTA